MPDCFKAWSKNNKVILRSPSSTRPWQHVLEPISGYLALGMNLSIKKDFSGEAFNFGPHTSFNHSVLELVKEMSSHWDKVKWDIQDSRKEKLYESKLLQLNCDKSFFNLRWQSCLDFKQTVEYTVNWYKNFFENKDSIKDFSENQILRYMQLAKSKDIYWAI